MRIKILSLLSLFLLMGFSSVYAQGAGTSAVPFLLISPGAKAGGMGESGVALANDATAVFWNPAGLAFQYDPENYESEHNFPFEVSLMHTKWLPQFNFDDLFYDYAAVRYYIDGVGTIGGSFTFLNLGESQATGENGEDLGTFDSKEYALTLSYSEKIKSNLSLGINVKYIKSDLVPKNVTVGSEQTSGQANSVALDLGVLWVPDFEFLQNKLSVGANLSNLGPAITYNDKKQEDPIPTHLRMGVAYNIIDDEFNKLIGTYELGRLLVHKEGATADKWYEAVFYSSWTKPGFSNVLRSFTHGLGLEYWYGNLFALRTGYFNEQADFGNRKFLTFGAGIVINSFGVDFGYISDSEDSPLSDTMRFSLSFKY